MLQIYFFIVVILQIQNIVWYPFRYCKSKDAPLKVSALDKETQMLRVDFSHTQCVCVSVCVCGYLFSFHNFSLFKKI